MKTNVGKIVDLMPIFKNVLKKCFCLLKVQNFISSQKECKCLESLCRRWQKLVNFLILHQMLQQNVTFEMLQYSIIKQAV